MPTYLEVAVNVPQVSGVFHYHLPPELEGEVQAGQVILAPFGSQIVQGIVVGFVDKPMVAETRAILDIIDPAITLTTFQIALAQALSRELLASLATWIGLMLPPGLEQQADLLYTAQGRTPEDLSVTQKRLLNLLYQRGPLRGQQIDRVMTRANWRSAARSLERRGLLRSERVISAPTVHPKIVQTARLACTPATAEAALDTLGKPGAATLARRQAILRYLIKEGEAVETAWLYAESGGNISDLRFLEGRGLISLGKSETWRDPLIRQDYPLYEAPTLTNDQQSVWKEVNASLHETNVLHPPDELNLPASTGSVLPILLHGVTGSGKTEIYLRAVQETLNQGRQAIVLVPEIALTPQTIQRFAGRFPGQVGLFHSKLSAGERYDTWRRARLGELSLVIGPRSALFTPFSKLGLIILDECHDDSYYQAEQAPYYHARDVAVIYARVTRAVCLMGSATPDITSVYQGQQGKWQILELPTRILAHRAAVQAQMEQLSRLRLEGERGSHYRLLEGQAETIDLPPVRVVDMREELKAGNRSIFSQPLQLALKDAIEHGEQSILFLNRRGSATYVFCRDCGHTLRCPKCDVPLTFHEVDHALRCHYCNYRRKMPEVCPNCGSKHIRQYGTGTQKVEADLHAIFPHVRTIRWDHETTRKKGAHAAILQQFSAHAADVLVGTQMLAKGMDLPLVTLVGVVLADVGLNLPDYRANERTFQILTQVAGRAGRSPLGGQVILQTFQPEHYVIRAASGHDFKAFYEQELAYRRQLGYPPFVRLARLEYRNLNPEKAERAALDLASQIQGWMKEDDRRLTRMIGPAPSFFSHQNGYARWQIVLCGPDPVGLLRGRSLGEWKVEIDPPNLL